MHYAAKSNIMTMENSVIVIGSHGLIILMTVEPDNTILIYGNLQPPILIYSKLQAASSLYLSRVVIRNEYRGHTPPPLERLPLTCRQLEDNKMCCEARPPGHSLVTASCRGGLIQSRADPLN